jgi:ABC-2 type transport system permease protein
LGLERYWPATTTAFRFVLANRTQYLLQVLGEVLQVTVLYFIWRAVYGQKEIVGGMTEAEMITYLFVSQVFRILVSHSQTEWQLGYWIRTGDLVRQLIQPLPLIWNDFWRAMGWLLAVGGLSGGLLLCAGILVFGVQLPSLVHLPALVISLLLAVSISFGISFFVGGLAFWTDGSTWGLSTAKGVLLAFTSGAMIPLSLFPDWLRTLVGYLPFQAGVHVPTAIYLGQLHGADLWQALALQLFWAVVLLILADRFFAFSLRRVTISGG